MQRLVRFACWFSLCAAGVALAEDAPRKTIPARAFCVPKETATEGEGYFSIIEGLNQRLYIGTHANAVNSWLVEFDPAAAKMAIVVDAHKAIGIDLKGFGSQSKIHTRNNVGPSGKVYFGTKQGYPTAAEKREDYPGGYPMVYDPKTGQTKVYPIPVPHHGINSITPDESRGVAYISTCSDHRPGPGENSIFLILDLNTGMYRTLMDTEHIYGFIVVDHLGRAYHPILGGDIARYDPQTDRLERLKQTIDGAAPTPETRVALPQPDPINWDISPDGKTLYSLPMSANGLYAYDLTASGDTLPGRSLGELLPGMKDTDCRAMCCGPTGDVWIAVTVKDAEIGLALHMVSYRPGDKSPIDHGIPAVQNPDFTEFKDKEGKDLPFHGGYIKTKDGIVTPRYVNLGVCQTRDGRIYTLVLHPYSVLQIENPRTKPRTGVLLKDRPYIDKGKLEETIYSISYWPRSGLDKMDVSDEQEPIANKTLQDRLDRQGAKYRRTGICFTWSEKALLPGTKPGSDFRDWLVNYCLRENIDLFTGGALGREGPTHGWIVQSSETSYLLDEIRYPLANED